MDIDSVIDEMARDILIGTIGQHSATLEDELKMVALIRSHGHLLARRLEDLVREDWAAFSLPQQNPQPDAGSKRP